MRSWTVPLLLLALATAPARAEPPQWQVDASASRIGFEALQMGATLVGTFRIEAAEIEFDPAEPEGGWAVVTVDVASVDTRSARHDEAIRSPDWLDAASHPTAEFIAEEFTGLDAGRFQAVGRLTLRGTTRRIRFPFSLEVAARDSRRTARMEAEIPVLRSEFGIGRGEWAGDSVVGNRVVIRVVITAEATP
jgi:polyisoprenoid-binding protein YceI